MRELKYYMPGILMIAIALLVVAVPEILVAFVTAAMIMIGIGLLLLGHRIRKAEIRLDKTDDPFYENNFFGHRFARSPVFTRWRRRF